MNAVVDKSKLAAGTLRDPRWAAIGALAVPTPMASFSIRCARRVLPAI